MVPLQFGILMVPYQTVDAAMPIDILTSCSTTTFALMEKIGHPLGALLKSKAISIEFHHISTSLDPVVLSGNYNVLPTCTTETCPSLNYLLIGGPDPTYTLPEEFVLFIKKHVEDGKVLFATCTGALAISPTGILDGKRATTNHEGLGVARSMRPQVNWEKKQWVVDGNLWTAGGACAGMDMMAHWVVQNYGMEIAKAGFANLDFEPRDMQGKRVVLV